MSDPIVNRRFEFKSDRAYKFWAVKVKQKSVTVKYGRIGSTGQTREKLFTTNEEAEAHAEREIAKKKKAGYKEVIKNLANRKTNAQLWEELEPHKPFLQSILDAPDELGNYMVYADWLMEQGDPRGQFILSSLAVEDPQTPMWDQTKHQKLATEIRIANWREWLGELSPFFQNHGYFMGFYRGLISSFQIHSLGVPLALSLKNSPHCRMLRGLRINSTQTNQTTIEIDGVRYEADKNYGLQPLFGAELGNLRTFEFSSQQAGGDEFGFYVPNRRQTGIPTFQFIRSMSRLQSLTLNTSFYEQEYQFLFDSEIPNLVEFELEDRFGNGPIEDLCRSNWMEQLRSLKLVCDLDDDICELLADSLDPNVMERIDVIQNRITEEGRNTIEKTGVTVTSF